MISTFPHAKTDIRMMSLFFGDGANLVDKIQRGFEIRKIEFSFDMVSREQRPVLGTCSMQRMDFAGPQSAARLLCRERISYRQVRTWVLPPCEEYRKHRLRPYNVRRGGFMVVQTRTEVGRNRLLYILTIILSIAVIDHRNFAIFRKFRHHASRSSGSWRMAGLLAIVLSADSALWTAAAQQRPADSQRRRNDRGDQCHT